MVKAICSNCGKEIEKYNYQIKQGNVYCNQVCAKSNKINIAIQKYCEVVGTDDLKSWLKQKYEVEHKSIRKICNLLDTKANRTVIKLLQMYEIDVKHGSDAVRTQWIDAKERREQNRKLMIETMNIIPRDKESLPIQELRKTSEYSEWRLKVWFRDNFTCQCCGKRRDKDVKINAHHLNSFKTFPKIRYDVTNGITLCEKCHNEFHAKYGREESVKEMYIEFVTNKLELDKL